MPVNKARCGPAGSSAPLVKAPKAPGRQEFDGTKNTDAGQPPIKHPDWQGPGVVLGDGD